MSARKRETGGDARATIEQDGYAGSEATADDELPWAVAPDKVRRQALRHLFIARDIEERIVSVVKSAVRDRHLHAEAQNVIITGETGVGKSEIMKRILAAHPEGRDPDTRCVVRPVLYVDVRNCSTPKAVAQAMLVQLMTLNGEPLVVRPVLYVDVRNCSTPKAVAQAMLVQLMTLNGEPLVDIDKLVNSVKSLGVPEITRRVKTQMMAQGVVLAMLDEFHNTVSDNGTDRLNRIANWVRDFAKSKSRSAAKPDGELAETIVFVLIGTKKVELIVDPSLNDELASITPYRIKVDRYRYGSDEEKETFRALLADIDDELPFDEHAGLDEPSLAEKLHFATFGLLRQLGIIVVKAADLAIEDGSDRIREHHLHAAVELKRGVLESHLMSAEAEGEERRIVENPFAPPEPVARNKVSGKRGWKP